MQEGAAELLEVGVSVSDVLGDEILSVDGSVAGVDALSVGTELLEAVAPGSSEESVVPGSYEVSEAAEDIECVSEPDGPSVPELVSNGSSDEPVVPTSEVDSQP